MTSAMDRRRFLGMGMAASAVAASPAKAMGWAFGQAAQVPDRVAQGREAALKTPITTTKLYDNVYLLQGAGGNMALQTGRDGLVLIDSSFSTSVPKVREAIAAVSHDSAEALINTHWHYDHTDGNEGMRAAGYSIYAHKNTRERMSTPQTIQFFHLVMPPSPAPALPSITFSDSMQAWHNGDSLDMVHFDPAHTDTDIYIHFQKANVLHVGDIWFNGFYPFIDESTGGAISGMINASAKALAVADGSTKIIPGHGPLGAKADLQKYHDMLSAVRDKVAALKAGGASEQEVVAKKPTADFDAAWGKGMLGGDVFAGIVYRTV